MLSASHVWASKMLLASFTGIAVAGTLWMIQRRIAAFLRVRTFDWVMAGQLLLLLGLLPLTTWFLEIIVKTPKELFVFSRDLAQVGAGLVLSATGLVVWALAERRRSRAQPTGKRS